MIVTIAGKRYRLFFNREDVPSRYEGKQQRKKKNAAPKTVRTECRLEADGGTTSAGKIHWLPVASAVVYRNHQDAESAQEGRRRAFTRMMRHLTVADAFGAAGRREIADQYFAQTPKRPSYAQLRREVSGLRARVAILEKAADPSLLSSEEYVAYLKPAGRKAKKAVAV